MAQRRRSSTATVPTGARRPPWGRWGLTASGRLGPGSGKRDRAVRGQDDEAVACESVDRFRIEILTRRRRGRDEAERLGAPLPERALERPLLPRRLVACADRRAGLGKGTDPAPRDPGQADRG